MCDRTVLLQRIETAESATPFCTCGARMAAVDREGALWLECTASDRTRGVARRLVDRLWIHSRLHISEAARSTP
jgi:hypothetical protein